jgi:catechol 2,3-dioxygenase-like lactoylglutathione lyase family enzyme
MFSHIMIGTNDLDKAKSFYDALLGTLDVRPAKVDRHRIFYFTKTGTFSVSKPIDGKPATPANGGTIGFVANSPEQADAWHAAGIANGATTCEERANSIWRICAIPTATRSARCIGYRRKIENCRVG